jgi:hypothetical protein
VSIFSPSDGFAYASVPTLVSSILQFSYMSFPDVLSEDAFVIAEGTWFVLFLEYVVALFTYDFLSEQFFGFVIDEEYVVGSWVRDVDYLIEPVA